jgi:hypothetical protein
MIIYSSRCSWLPWFRYQCWSFSIDSSSYSEAERSTQRSDELALDGVEWSQCIQGHWWIPRFSSSSPSSVHHLWILFSLDPGTQIIKGTSLGSLHFFSICLKFYLETTAISWASTSWIHVLTVGLYFFVNPAQTSQLTTYCAILERVLPWECQWLHGHFGLITW